MVRPLVSVVIPAYNASRWITDAINSVLGQSLQDFEVIVVDDGSKDGTATIARSIGDARVHVVSQPNAGVSAARNKGIDQARGRFIALLDADDALEPEALMRKVYAIRASDAKWAFSDLLPCDADMQPMSHILRGRYHDLLRITLLGEELAVPGPGSNLVMDRACFDEGYRFPVHLSNAADRHITLYMAHRFKHAYVAEPLARYRILPQSMSHDIALYASDHLRLIKEAEGMGMLNNPAIRRSVHANAYWSVGGSWLRKGRSFRRALPYFCLALFHDPGVILRWYRRRRKV